MVTLLPGMKEDDSPLITDALITDTLDILFQTEDLNTGSTIIYVKTKCKCIH